MYKIIAFASAIYLFLSPLTAQALTLMSWNIEWLTAINAESSRVTRKENDVAKLHSMINDSGADIIALQEVNSIDAVQQVVGAGYTIFLSDRARPAYSALQFDDQNQYTALAIRPSLLMSDPTDLVLTKDRKLRFATYVIVEYQNKPIHLLSVHLKSGCFTRYKEQSYACFTLKQQGQALNQWIKAREDKHESYLILGDFNHNLAYPNDWLWTELQASLTNKPSLATSLTKSTCLIKGKNGKTKRYPWLIDHMISSKDLDLTDAKQTAFPKTWLQESTLSDHCPVTAQL